MLVFRWDIGPSIGYKEKDHCGGCILIDQGGSLSNFI